MEEEREGEGEGEGESAAAGKKRECRKQLRENRLW